MAGFTSPACQHNISCREGRKDLKITKIDSQVCNFGGRNEIFVKVHTDAGIQGVGEAYSPGPDLAAVEVIKDFERWLIGRDPREVERLWQFIVQRFAFPGRNRSRAPQSVVSSTPSGTSRARRLGAPVYELLGGKCRDKIRVYQSVGGDTPAEIGDHAKRLVETYGFTALKMGPHPPNDQQIPVNVLIGESARRMEAVRKAVGDAIDIGVDPHARIFNPTIAIQMAEVLKPYRPFFFEEPLRPENLDALADLKARVTIPIATGECLYTKFQFRNLLVREACDYVQPDICLAGGISETKKIAAMAESFYVGLIPHNPLGPLANAINVQLAAATPNFVVLEYHTDDQPPRSNVLKESLQFEDGYLRIPDGPGLGVELDEVALSQYQPKPWRRPVPFRPDGSVGFM